MTRVIDFRTTQFSPERIGRCGANVGQRVYPKLYRVENLLRILIHSVLTSQIGNNWWQTAVDATIRKSVSSAQRRYLSRPWHTNPGSHEIYYTDLFELLEIARANAHLLAPVVVDINQWIVKVDSIRLPRNVVAHMNFPNAQDRRRIDTILSDLEALIAHLQTNSVITFQIP